MLSLNINFLGILFKIQTTFYFASNRKIVLI